MRRVSWKRQDKHEGRRQECRRRFGKKTDIHKLNNCGSDLKIRMVTSNLTCLKIPTLKSLMVHKISKMVCKNMKANQIFYGSYEF